MKYTEDQLEAINHIHGNIQIIACAGSGKTQTISARIAKIVSSGVPKEQILAFTFTEKAANEMKFRIRSQLEEKFPDNPELGGMYVGTIHAFCFQYLKEVKAKYRNYDIIDDNKRLLLLSRERFDIGLEKLKKRKKEPLFLTPLRFLRTINMVKQDRISIDELKDSEPDFYTCYEKYNELMIERKFFDFPTIIESLVNILESEPEELKKIREKIKYLVVDEYQDINTIQEKLIYLISGKDGNLCVVGDDDQAIFEFQGANTDNIQNFSTKYDAVRQVNLLKNFRSTDDFPMKLETEKPFEFVLDDALIAGQIDLITKLDPITKEVLDVNLIDFKTEKKEGRRKRYNSNLLQLRLYALAAGRALGLNPVNSYVHYLTDNDRYPVGVTENKLKEAREIINQTVQGIKRRDFKKIPEKSQCEKCDFNLICSKKN